MTMFVRFCTLFGLHPFVAFGMAAVDWMLFGPEAASLGASWPISIAVAIALSIPCILIQKYGMREAWGLAIGKGLMVAVLTAIPTALPSGATLVGGALGIIALLATNKGPDETADHDATPGGTSTQEDN